MNDTLKNQLLGLGFKPAPATERQPEPRRPPEASERRDGRRLNSSPATPAAANTHRKNRPSTSPRANSGRPDAGSATNARSTRSREEIDLGKAYALRNEHEKRERIAAEQKKQDEARERREAKARLSELLKDRALNDAAAEHVRHFEYGGKIKRIHVTAEQLKALNAGQLGVLQEGGRYLLVTAAVLAEAEAIFAPAIALKVDPDAPAADDPYSDPAYQVPDDLIW